MRKHCNYETSMMLKAHGYDELCEMCYSTAIRHNGEDLSFDDEMDLKEEGRGDEIEYVPGGWVERCYNKNSELFADNENDCSAPYIQDVLDWLMKQGFYVAVDFYCDYDEFNGQKYYHDPTWDYTIKRLSDGSVFLHNVDGICYGDKETAEEGAIREYLKKLD